MLLDDVMSELDATAARCSSALLAARAERITTTDLAHVPGAGGARVVRVARSRPAASRQSRRSRNEAPSPRRGAPALAIEALADRLPRQTLLAGVQRLWPEVVGADDRRGR